LLISRLLSVAGILVLLGIVPLLGEKKQLSTRLGSCRNPLLSRSSRIGQPRCLVSDCGNTGYPIPVSGPANARTMKIVLHFFNVGKQKICDRQHRSCGDHGDTAQWLRLASASVADPAPSAMRCSVLPERSL